MERPAADLEDLKREFANVGIDDWDDPLLTDTVSPQQLKEQVGEQLAKMTPEAPMAFAKRNVK